MQFQSLSFDKNRTRCFMKIFCKYENMKQILYSKFLNTISSYYIKILAV